MNFRVRQRSCSGRGLTWRAAGEEGHVGAGQGQKWNPNTNAHPTMAGTSSEMGHSGGATRRSGGERTGKTAMTTRELIKPANARISNSRVQGTYRRVADRTSLPEACRRRRTVAAAKASPRAAQPEQSGTELEVGGVSVGSTDGVKARNRQEAHLTGDGEEKKLRGRKMEPASIPGLL